MAFLDTKIFSLLKRSEKIAFLGRKNSLHFFLTKHPLSTFKNNFCTTENNYASLSILKSMKTFVLKNEFLCIKIPEHLGI